VAILLNIATGEKVILTVQHVFGRHFDTSNTVLYDKHASRMHAIIFWEGERWRLKDVSTNAAMQLSQPCPKLCFFSHSCLVLNSSDAF